MARSEIVAHDHKYHIYVKNSYTKAKQGTVPFFKHPIAKVKLRAFLPKSFQGNIYSPPDYNHIQSYVILFTISHFNPCGTKLSLLEVPTKVLVNLLKNPSPPA